MPKILAVASPYHSLYKSLLLVARMDGRVVIAKLLLLAQDPQNQTIVARDEGCMMGLVASVVHADPEIVIIASRTLQFLSGHPQNKKSMKDFPNLVENLLQTYSTTANDKIKEFCFETLDNLGVSVTSAGSNDELNESNESCLDENYAPNGSKQSYSKFNIFLDDLENDNTCVLAQRILINVPGVISVSLDKSRGAAAVGTREVDTDGLKKKLVDALQRAGITGRLKARTLIVNEVDEEDQSSSPMPEPDTSVNTSACTDENSGYLEEADYYGEKESAMTRWGPSSLEARLEQERREEEMRAAQTGRILTKVSSALASVSNWLGGW
jgi:hypothetical protein